ncbi:hypothetical protein [Microbacterium sp. B24]|uniref:hypothetical protein n=1 Tax=Microbacterium sp. B24 TaxID=95616 RepID=UPI000560DDEC|nr:hypothetical protein [Microbacterium sp. B24]
MTLFEIPIRRVERLGGEYTLVAEGEDRFIEAYFRAKGWEVTEDTYLLIRMTSPWSERPRQDLVRIPIDFTVAQFDDFTRGTEWEFDPGGYGGDGRWHEPLASAWEVVNAGFSLQSVIGFVMTTGRTVSQIRYLKYQQMAEDWRDEGAPAEIPKELLQMVKSENPWWRSHFDFVFKLDGITGAALLRAAGYRKTFRDTNDALWLDESEPHNSRFVEPQGYPSL